MPLYETLLSLTSLYFNQDILALRKCAVTSILLLEAPQGIYLSNGVYHFFSQEPTKDLKSDFRTHGLSLPSIDCQACDFRPSCESSTYVNQSDLVLTPDMDDGCLQNYPGNLHCHNQVGTSFEPCLSERPVQLAQFVQLLSWFCLEINP